MTTTYRIPKMNFDVFTAFWRGANRDLTFTQDRGTYFEVFYNERGKPTRLARYSVNSEILEIYYPDRPDVHKALELLRISQ